MALATGTRVQLEDGRKGTVAPMLEEISEDTVVLCDEDLEQEEVQQYVVGAFEANLTLL